MTCAQIREAISADLDGEELPVDRELFHHHLATCTACRGYETSLVALHRRTRLGLSPAVPDLTSRVLFAIDDVQAWHEPSGQGLRLGLACIALIQLALSVPALILGDDAGLPVHSARHLGAFGVALAIGLLAAAWKPQRIAGLLPLVAALVACLVGSSVLDVATGHAVASGEFGHVTEILGLVALWLLARSGHEPLPMLHTR
jgi:predicted anti-sigma-YlaC factor YlaD